MRGRSALGVLVVATALAGCSSAPPPGRSAGAPASSTPSDPSPAVRTLSPLPQPSEAAPSGRLIADLRQSSRDAAAGRMEVWIDNDTLDEVTPTAIRYLDRRFRAPLDGERLREIPAGSERGFPLYLPARPACGTDGSAGRIEVTRGGETVILEVEDSVDLVSRHVASRCAELEVAEIADLSWADTVTGAPVQPGDEATLTLVISPTGAPGRIRIETVNGTPVLAADGAPFWTVDRTVSGGDPVTRIPLPLKPNRCDEHAFLESGGATAFRVALRLDGKPVDLVLRMSTAGAAAAIDYAQRSCGFGD